MSHDRFPGRLALPLHFPNQRFRLWLYAPSHSELVLRTEFAPSTPHVELLFKPVRHINLPVTMGDGLIVDLAGPPDTEADLFTFAVGNDHFSGQVTAGHLFLRQEDRSRYSPFSLFHGYLRSDFER